MEYDKFVPKSLKNLLTIVINYVIIIELSLN